MIVGFGSVFIEGRDIESYLERDWYGGIGDRVLDVEILWGRGRGVCFGSL